MHYLFARPSIRLGLLLSVMMASAQAAEPESKLQYNFIQASYFELNSADDVSGHGKGIDGNIPWGRLPYYTLIRFIDPDNDYQDRLDHQDEPTQYSLEVGIGRHQAITEHLDWTVAVLYHIRENGLEHDEPDGEGAISDEGPGLQLGLRHLPVDQFEWGVEIAAVNLDNTELHRSAYLQWHANSFAGFGVKLLKREHDQMQSFYLRISF